MARPNAQWLGLWRDMILSPEGPKDAGAKLVALAIAKYVRVATLSTFVGAERIAQDTALNEKTVRKHMTSLCDAGFLSAESKRRGRDWKVRVFTLQAPAHAPEVSSGARNNARAPEDFSGVPEKNALGSGSFFLEHRKKGPTNSGSLNTKENTGYRARPFPSEKDQSEQRTPIPDSLNDELQKKAVAKKETTAQARIEKAAKLAKAVPDTTDQHLMRMYQLTEKQVLQARNYVL